MDKSIEAAAAAYEEAFGNCGGRDGHISGLRAAIAAYRDAEIERLTAENLKLLNSMDAIVHALEIEDYDIPPEEEIMHLRAKLEASNKELREIAESINDPRVNLTMTAAEWCIEAQSKLEAAERDAERYREWKRAFREGECGLWNALCEANSESEHDAAIDAARGGERG